MLGLLWGFVAGPVAAQAPYRQELIPGFTSFSVGSGSSPELVDLDGDSDLDVVVGEGGGGLRYFENTGSSSAPAFVATAGAENPLLAIRVAGYSNPKVVDLDGDGDLDVVVGQYDGGLRYFENTAAPSSFAFIERSGTANPLADVVRGYNTSPELVDLDGDGDFDVVLGGCYYGGQCYYENTGTATAPAMIERQGEANPFDDVGGGGDSPELADLDGDGDLDAVFGDSSGGLDYFENTGSAARPAFVRPSGTAHPFIGIPFGIDPKLVDLDGDGDCDAVVGVPTEGRLFFENTGSSVTPAFVARVGSANPVAGIDSDSGDLELVDLDGDGDLDAVLGSLSGNVLYFENTGSATAAGFVQRTGATNPFSHISGYYFDASLELADLDGDSDLDVVFGEFSENLFYFENVGSSNAPMFVERTGAANPFAGTDFGSGGVELVDLDRDGDVDGLGRSTRDGSGFFENVGSSSVPVFVERTGHPFAGSNIHGVLELVDLDGDTDLDVVAGAYGHLVFFRSFFAGFAEDFEGGALTAWQVPIPKRR